MTARIIDGKAIAAEIEAEVQQGVEAFQCKAGRPPHLMVVLLGNDAASNIYVKKKQAACARVGIKSSLITDLSTPEDLNSCLVALGSFDRDNIDGVLLQLPLPSAFGDPVCFFEKINPCQDVDVFHPLNVGRLIQGHPYLEPCAPAGIREMIYRSNIPLAGKHVVVISRSVVVGKPLSSILIQDNDFANATVTVCHDRTPHEVLRGICLSADIIVVAVGKAGFLTKDMVSPWTGVVDVGTNRVDGKLVGDVHPEILEVVDWITPVPGGIGPLTVSMLLKNTLKAAEARSG